MKKLLISFNIVALMALALPALAQESEDLYELSLEDLMQIDIYSVSKKAESLFEAPLSSSTLTKEEIYNAGATSIPEALRLMPGLIVREMTNGSYDVHLRGFDNINRYGDGTSSANQITLVMIDGRPVFNNNLGGTNWEALPIDLIDVERIEVVRGPSAPLYGPNAVAGVINIITKNIDKDGVSINANLAAGTDNTQVGGLSLGYKFNDKLSAQLSGNIQLRDRQDDSFFEYGTNAYTEDIANNFETAVDKKGINLMLDYAVAEDFNIGLQTGLQRAEVVKPFNQNDVTPLSTSVYESEYVNLTFDKSGLVGRFSYTTGFDNLNKEAQQIVLQYDYSNTDASLEYNWVISDKISLRPGISYQEASYSDKEYTDPSQLKFGVLGAKRTIDNYAGSLMADITLTENWRLVAGGRVDKFSSPDEAYASYQFATTYDINDKNMVRFVASKSNSGSFVGPNYLNVQLPPNLYYQGNQNLDLFQIQMLEIGYRTKLSSSLELNIELFTQTAKNTNSLVAMIPQPPYAITAEYFEYVNMPLEATQNGITISANYVPSTKVQFKPFVTFQKTDAENIASSLSIIGLNDLSDQENDQTPAVYGGFYLNMKATDKLTFNLNPYFTGEQQQYSFYDNFNPATEIGQIDSRLILNAKVNYKLSSKFDLYVNGRNLLNQEKNEFYGTDRTSMLLMAGLRANL